MLGIAVVLVLAIWLAFLHPILQNRRGEVEHSEQYNAQMKKLWSAAQSSMKESKTLRAEKALLTILKFDEKNAAAYNRLGILYAKEQKFEEAIECFEIAQSLDNNPSSLHNVGLIYLETGAYEKAAMAFEQAIELEDNLPARFLALAKAKEKLGQNKAAIEALEKAYLLDHSVAILRSILTINENMGDIEAISNTTARIEKQIEETALAKARARRRKQGVQARQQRTAHTTRSTVATRRSATRMARPTASRTGQTAANSRQATVRKTTVTKPSRKIQ